ncbi:hypothetical protein [Streptococcus catagoni]|nr:hypothetical protein [Streptococcus catagoni]
MKDSPTMESSNSTLPTDQTDLAAASPKPADNDRLDTLQEDTSS